MSQNLEPQPLSDDFGDYARAAPTTRETADHAELAACPFCGGAAVAGSNFDNDHYVMCGRDCDQCGGMVGYMRSPALAVEHWNRRANLVTSVCHAELLAKLKRVKYVREAHDEPYGTYAQPCDADDYGAEAVPINPDGIDAASALENLLSEIAALRGEVERSLPSISHDGEHAISDHRRWLARQLLDSKLDDGEAYSIVAYHPAITDLRTTQAERQRDDMARALLSIAEGNLGDEPWQASYETIKQVARNALANQGAE